MKKEGRRKEKTLLYKKNASFKDTGPHGGREGCTLALQAGEHFMV